MAYRIGIDAGSKTIKVVILDESGKIVHYIYEKHRAAIRETLADVLHRIVWCHGDFVGPVAITGSAGMGVAQVLHIPFVQEVVATAKAVQCQYPDADAVIELGGEDAKVMYLSGNPEQRMNATCAGGTGGFIDNLAFMLGVKSEQMNSLAMSARKTYPIASRCAVFAQTDVRPLLNAGAKKSDIAASAFDAVVRQTLGGLSCGRPITGKVLFLGGPLEHNSELVRRFKVALDLGKGMGIKPAEAHLFTAKGAAIVAGLDDAPALSLKVLERRVLACADPEDDLDHLPPLFEDEAERIEFTRRHSRHAMPSESMYSYEGDAYLGLDAGSTTVKMALLTTDGKLLYSDYQPVDGDSLATASLMLGNMYRLLPKHYATKKPYIRIAYSAVTGYGEDLLKAALRIDTGVVETMAHMKAALHFDPQTSFVLDIGGQDMKAMWLSEGQITDIMLNEACSSGCGSFIEGTAYSLQTRPHPFNRAALESKNPIDLGTKCTVFMTSRVRHAQKIGAPLADIAAGVAYSVVQNALFRIIGRSKVSTMGKHVVVQGGAFKSDAVLRAFEKVSGVEAIRPNTAHLMGAIGAALFAREQAVALSSLATSPIESTIVDEEQRKSLSFEQRSEACPGCSNMCCLSILTFNDGRSFVGGNRCPRANELVLNSADESQKIAPNVVKVQQSLLNQYLSAESSDELLGGISVGLMTSLHSYEQLPFWHTLIRGLGFGVKVPSPKDSPQLRAKAAESVASESVCFAAKVSHERLYDLLESGAHAVFMPRFLRRGSCAVSCGYADALRDAAEATAPRPFKIIAPFLEGEIVKSFSSSSGFRRAIMDALFELCANDQQKAALEHRFDSALALALEEQGAFEAKVKRATDKALAWVAEDEARHAVIMGGRPYHLDPAMLHGVDDVAASLGLAVIPPVGVGIGQMELADKRSEWPHVARLSAMAQQVIGNEQLELVCLESFGCGYDAVNLPLVRDELLEADKTFTSLKLDDIVDVAHIRIRLRTLAESFESRKIAKLRREEHQRNARSAIKLGPNQLSWTNKPGLGGGIDLSSPQMLRRQNSDYMEDDSFVVSGLALPGIMTRTSQWTKLPDSSWRHESENERMAVKMARDALNALKPIVPPTTKPLPPGASAKGADVVDAMAGGIRQEDFETARDKMPADLCPTAALLAARCVGAAENDRFVKEIRVPRVCESCLVESIPLLVDRCLEKKIKITWSDAKVLGAGLAEEELPPLDASSSLRIGIVGNPLHCFDPAMNDGIAEKLKGLGCVPVFPDPALVCQDDVRYVEQLARFREQGVEHVIYLQSFGCLKGHVQSRGALRGLEKAFPDLPITVIDFDPEASALNRENRIRLVVESAREKRPTASRPVPVKDTGFAWMGAIEELVAEGAQRLAVGEDPLQGGSATALAYLLEEGVLKDKRFESSDEALDVLNQHRNALSSQLEQIQRDLLLVERGIECLNGR